MGASASNPVDLDDEPEVFETPPMHTNRRNLNQVVPSSGGHNRRAASSGEPNKRTMKQAPAPMRRPPSPPSWPCRGQPQWFPSGGRPMDDENLTFETSAGVEVVGSFYTMGIREDLLRGIYGYGFEKPSTIQQRAVIPIISGHDVIAQA
ncbi:hypothetical protein ZWY2020_022302 [Hordeum vulgare]|nr:hypothetical protein ZWY2020_022302 [Hordeum vulgare]